MLRSWNMPAGHFYRYHLVLVSYSMSTPGFNLDGLSFFYFRGKVVGYNTVSWQHSGSVASKDWGLSVWSLCIHFLPQSWNVHIWLIDDSKLTLGVCVCMHGCFSVTLLQTSNMSMVLDLASNYKYVVGFVLSHQKISTNRLVMAAACQWT